MSQVIADDGGDPTGVDLIYANGNQCSTLFDLDMNYIQGVVDHDLFWTWNLNFNLQPSNVSNVDFYGCLHFFWRDIGLAEFHPAAEYILTPCHIENLGAESLSWQAGPTLYSSLYDYNVDTTQVHFPGESHIWCDVNLAEYGADFANSSEFHAGVTNYWSDLVSAGIITRSEIETLTWIQDELTRLRSESPTQYPSFSLGGVAAELGANDTSIAQPLIYYQPQGCSSPLCSDLWLEPQVDAFPEINLQGGIGSQEYTVDKSHSECLLNLARSRDCNIAQAEGAWLYMMEYGHVTSLDDRSDNCAIPGAQFSSFLLFHARMMVTSSGDWRTWCPEVITPNIYLTPAPKGLEAIPPFGTDGATIFVGYNPVSQNHASGEIFEVWIDPDGTGGTGGQ